MSQEEIQNETISPNQPETNTETNEINEINSNTENNEINENNNQTLINQNNEQEDEDIDDVEILELQQMKETDFLDENDNERETTQTQTQQEQQKLTPTSSPSFEISGNYQSFRPEFSIYHKKWEDHTEIDMTNGSENWRIKRKHVFIYTDAGKPIFSRYGDEIKLAPFMGTLTALSSVVADACDENDDVVCDDGKTIVFHSVGPIEIVFVAKTGETPMQLKIQAEMIGRKICSIVPYTTIISLFQRKTSYDFRRLILSEYDQMKYIIHSMNASTAISYNSVSIVPCANRDQLNDVMNQQIRKCNDELRSLNDSIVFTLIIDHLRLLHITQRVGCLLSPKDIHILMTFVQALPTTNDKWVPIGLYDFNQAGQLFLMCKFLSNSTVVLLLTTKNESLSIMSPFGEKLVNVLMNVPYINQLAKGQQNDLVYEDNVSLYLHYLYVKIEDKHGQIHEPQWKEPYKNELKEQKRIHRMYRSIYEEMKENNLKEYCSKGGVDGIYATLTKDFFFCGNFNILLDRDEIINRGNKIITMIRSKMDTFFIPYVKKGKYRTLVWV